MIYDTLKTNLINQEKTYGKILHKDFVNLDRLRRLGTLRRLGAIDRENNSIIVKLVVLTVWVVCVDGWAFVPLICFMTCTTILNVFYDVIEKVWKQAF